MPFRSAATPEALEPSPTLRRFSVVARLPAPLERLLGIARNLAWSWTPSARDLLVRVDPDLFEDVRGNAIALLARVSQERLEGLARDEAFLAHLEEAHAALAASPAWFGSTFPERSDLRVATFAMEYALDEWLPFANIDRGIEAADHLKAASDLGVPLVAVGLAFRTATTEWQRLPAVLVCGADGRRLVIHVDVADRVVHAQIWRIQVGRVPLFLLDTNVEENAPRERDLTAGSYGGDDERRIGQEIVLGIGGVHALEAMHISPTVCHVIEASCAFVALERIARFMRGRGASFEVASVASSAGTVFTTRSSTAEHDDAFDLPLVLRYLTPQRTELGLSEEALLELGRARPGDPTSRFSLAVLGIRTADRRQASAVSRRLWTGLWPDLPDHEVPFTEAAGGVHVPSWISRDLHTLFTRYLGPCWSAATGDPALWARVRAIPDAELWDVRQHRRHRLVEHVRAALGDHERLVAHGLTVGVAQGAADALFENQEALARLCSDADRAVQLVVLGAARALDPTLRSRVAFLDAPDLRTTRVAASGVDVWLGEGDAAARAAVNGAVVIETLDDQLARQFFDRPHPWHAPCAWMARIKGTLAGLATRSAARGLERCTAEEYLPAHARAAELLASELATATELVHWRQRIRDGWAAIEVVELGVARRTRAEIRVGDPVEIEARVRLGELGPYDVAVEVCYGPTAGAPEHASGAIGRMRVASANPDGTHTFAFAIPTEESGGHAFTARVLPWNALLGETRARSLVRWA